MRSGALSQGDAAWFQRQIFSVMYRTTAGDYVRRICSGMPHEGLGAELELNSVFTLGES